MSASQARREEWEAARLVAAGLRDIVERRIDAIVNALWRATRLVEDRPFRIRLYREFAGLDANLERLKEIESGWAGEEAVARAEFISARTVMHSAKRRIGW